ncbi:MAG: diguanylate cyclase [Sphingomonadaceae bacterium]|nr:diguanylate cyclase [Sphingomonadaceae bacterium]
MGQGIIRFCISMVALLLFVGSGGSACAADGPVLSPHCFASGVMDVTDPAGESLGSSWNCQTRRAPLDMARTYVRFKLSDDMQNPPSLLVARLGRFEQLTLTVVDDDGAWRSKTMLPGDMKATAKGPYFKAELPEVTADSRYVVAAFDRLNHRATAETAQLYSIDPAFTVARQRDLIVIAIILGMLLMPLAFNAAFYRVLREDFILWHSMMIGAFALLVGVRSGLINLFYSLDLMTWRTMLIWGLGLAAAAGVRFIHKVIEPGNLDPLTSRLMAILPVWTLAITGIHAADIKPLQSLGGDFHSIGMAPVIIICVWALSSALWRGSRAARYQVIGWTPLLVTFSAQIVTQLLPGFSPVEWLLMFYLGILAEAVATALGVADRFLDLKRQRDQARVQARTAESEAERDPLTGLMNRRALEPRFEALRAKGFSTLALLDLDNFKRINDDFGHAMGDKVLCAAAEALAPGDDVLAIRMGGEEFALLLRGPHAAQRAEMRREAISRHVAMQVQGLDRMVTASMGLLEITEGLGDLPFDEFYLRADRLLYEAKENGRNRTMAEAIRQFAHRPRSADRRSGEDRRNAPRIDAA